MVLLWTIKARVESPELISLPGTQWGLPQTQNQECGKALSSVVALTINDFAINM